MILWITIFSLFFSFLSEEFAEVMKKTVLNHRIPFNMDSDFIKLYFGKDKKRLINYAEFSQFLHVSWKEILSVKLFFKALKISKMNLKNSRNTQNCFS